MQTKIKEISIYERELEADLEYAEFSEHIEKNYMEEKKKAEIPGFRKGKAPLSMIKKLYGDAIEYKAAEKIANDKFWEIVKEKGVEPISVPQLADIDYKKDSALSFKIRFEVFPQLEIKNYKNVEFEKIIFKVKDELIEKEIEDRKIAFAEQIETDKIEDKYSLIKINLSKLTPEGAKDETALSKDFDVALYREDINAQLVENAIGKNIGDVFNFTFSDESRKIINGKEETVKEDFHYEAKVLTVKKLVLNDLNEEQIKKITQNKCSTIEEYKDFLKDNYAKYYESQSNKILENQIINKIIENNSFEVPPRYSESILERLVENEKEYAKKHNHKNFDETEAKEYFKEKAVLTSKWEIIIHNIAHLENITVEDEELMELAKKESEKSKIPAQKLFDYYKNSKQRDVLLEDKIMKFLTENNKIKEVDAEKHSKKEAKKK